MPLSIINTCVNKVNAAFTNVNATAPKFGGGVSPIFRCAAPTVPFIQLLSRRARLPGRDNSMYESFKECLHALLTDDRLDDAYGGAIKCQHERCEHQIYG